MQDLYTSGFTDEDRERINPALRSPDALAQVTGLTAPLRTNGATGHIDFLGLSATAWLGLPIYSRDEHIGSLYLASKESEQEFTDGDEHVGMVLAAHASSIISGSQRYDEANRARVELETLMDISPVAVSVFDARRGEITFANQESRRMLGVLGLKENEIENFYDALTFTRPDGREIPFIDLPGTRALQTGETIRAEEIVVHQPNGNTVSSLVNCAPLFSESGELVSLISVSQDMTPLEDLERRRNTFLGMVSEELTIPLMSIKGSAAALNSALEPLASNESNQLLRIIDQQTDLIRSQINSLTELTQIETGTLSVDAVPTHVAEFVEGSCREYLQGSTGVAIETSIPNGLPTMMADQHRMGQVLHNFLRQAATHAGERVRISVAASMIDIYVSVSVSVDVSRETPGTTPSPFHPTEPTQLLQQLRQAHDTQVSQLAFQGEGLAMAFCRGVVEAHGGRVATDTDDEQRRMTLTFTLPTVEDEEPVPLSDVRAVVSETVEAESTPILISIQDSRLQGAVRAVLRDAGYDTVSAPALDEVQGFAESEDPKLILMDIVDREDASFRVLRSVSFPRNLPAIVLCDRSDEEYVSRALDMGADGYIVKPFSPTELVARVRGALRRLNTAEVPDDDRTYHSGDVRINFDQRAVDVSGRHVALTATEYKLLNELASSPGSVFTHRALLRRVWGAEYMGEQQLLRSYIKSLRHKLADNARNPSYIFTEHGTGYRMARPDK